MRWEPKKHYEKLRTRLRRLKAVKTWQLVVILLLMAIIAATLLRLNNLGMLERRNAVIAADEKGDSIELQSSISELRGYVTAHMNTSLGNGFYLSHSYERAREAATRAAGDTDNPNSAVYQQASVECQSGAERVRYGGYVQCVIAKVSTVSGQENPVSALKLPRAESYKINFASPLWSFDLAGIAVAICLLIIVIIIVRFIEVIILKIMLKRRFSNI